MTDQDDVLDAALFRLWCRAASTHPGLVATKLAPCLTADTYRQALMEVARELRVNLPTREDYASLAGEPVSVLAAAAAPSRDFVPPKGE
jgi:hypothetical protein